MMMHGIRQKSGVALIIGGLMALPVAFAPTLAEAQTYDRYDQEPSLYKEATKGRAPGASFTLQRQCDWGCHRVRDWLGSLYYRWGTQAE